jgi:hypothetical protein
MVGCEFESEEPDEEMFWGGLEEVFAAVAVVLVALVGEVIRSDVDRRWFEGRCRLGRPPRKVAPGSCGLVGVFRLEEGGAISAAKGRKLGVSSSSSSFGTFGD